MKDCRQFRISEFLKRKPNSSKPTNFWVNSSGHFLMVITNSANTVGQPMQGCGGEAPATLSNHFRARLGQVGLGWLFWVRNRLGLGWVRFVLCYVWVRFRLTLGQVQVRLGLGQVCVQVRLGLDQVRLLLDNSVTVVIRVTITTVNKMSMKTHPKRGLLVDKSVHENSPKVSTKIHPFCP